MKINFRGSVATALLSVLSPMTFGDCVNTGPQNIAVIVADYEGSKVPVPNVSYLHELFLGSSGSLSIADFFRTVSGGRVSLNNIQVLGPYHVPHTLAFDPQGPLSHSSVMDHWKKELMAIADKDIDFKNINRVVFFTPAALDIHTGQEFLAGAGSASNYCDFTYTGAAAHQNFGQAWIRAQKRFAGIDPADISAHWNEYSAEKKNELLQQRKLADMEPIAHEIGHTFGLGHANRVSRPSVLHFPVTYDEVLPDADVELYEYNYGDVASFMGSSALGWPSVPHLAQLNWLDAKSIQAVKKNGTFRVYQNQNSGAVLKALRIPRWKQKNQQTKAELWLEYRQLRSAYDKNPLVTQMKNDGALVYSVNPDQPLPAGWNFPNQTVLLNFQPPGTIESIFPTDFTLKTEWKDTHSMVNLKILAVTPEYLDVRVTFQK